MSDFTDGLREAAEECRTDGLTTVASELQVAAELIDALTEALHNLANHGPKYKDLEAARNAATDLLEDDE